MVINTNIGAGRAHRLLEDSTSKLNGALQRLASGSRIVEPQDDAAGLAVATKFNAAISRNNAVQNNLSSALSYSQTQDGFLQKVSKALDKSHKKVPTISLSSRYERQLSTSFSKASLVL